MCFAISRNQHYRCRLFRLLYDNSPHGSQTMMMKTIIIRREILCVEDDRQIDISRKIDETLETTATISTKADIRQ